MSKLLDSVVKDIHSVLDSTRFTAHDFAVTSYDTDEIDGPLVRIVFIASRDFTFDILQQDPFQVDLSPGTTFVSETVYDLKIGDCMDLIHRWCQNILLEIRSRNLIYRDLDELRDVLQSQIDEHVDNTGTHFTPEEKEHLAQTLDEMRSEIDSLYETSKLNKEEIEKIKEQLSEMLEDLETFPKDIWYRTAANKLLRIFGSREVRQIAATTAKALLPGGEGDGIGNG